MREGGDAFALEGKRIYVAGHRGMVGRALCRQLEAIDCAVITPPTDASGGRLDLRRQAEVEAFLGDARPDVVVVAAAKVGGILANQGAPADFIYDNLAIEMNLIHGAFKVGVQKLLFLGSSCIYPKFAPQPIQESSLLTGALEPTNEWYAVAKIAGLKLCQAYHRQHGARFISAMPTNLYGPFDNFDPVTSHVLPGLMGRAHRAKRAGDPTLPIWGTGTPRREFLHVDDLARALIYLLRHYESPEPVNVGTGSDLAISEVARVICEVVGFKGQITFDHTKPDGTPVKRLDVSRLGALGWHANIPLRAGLEETYAWFLANTPPP